MKRAKGFSLIELLIVVAIILIIAAIAIPNLMRARMAANDSSAAGSVHDITVAEIGYEEAYPATGYAVLSNLGGTGTPCVASTNNGCFIDNSLAQGTKSGYTFTAVPSGALATGWQFYTAAGPMSSVSGTRSYCAADDAVLRSQVPTTPPASYAACLGLLPLSN